MQYGSIEYREKRNKDIQKWLNERFEIINSISDNYFQAICYFALMERFAQEHSSYPKHNSTEAFRDFVIEFQTSYAFINEYDPVTLFYDFEKELEKDYNLSFLNHGVYYNPDHAIQHGKADAMIESLKHLGKKKKNIERHKFVYLLYSLRSSLSHECSCHNNMMESNLHLLDEYPYYVSCSRAYYIGDSICNDNVWHLVMPVGFIKALAKECIDNYLNYSLLHKNDPFENDAFLRKSHVAWFD
jgi:hypothetical protein